MIILQLQTLTGCAKGLTRSSDVLFALDDSPNAKKEMEQMDVARADPSAVRVREDVIHGIESTMAAWSTDTSVADVSPPMFLAGIVLIESLYKALSDLFKSITALPSDMTLISLPAAPLLSLVCGAIQREPNAVWLSLASMFLSQLNPPSLLTTKAPVSMQESRAVVGAALPRIMDPSLQFLQMNDAMVSVSTCCHLTHESGF